MDRGRGVCGLGKSGRCACRVSEHTMSEVPSEDERAQFGPKVVTGIAPEGPLRGTAGAVDQVSKRLRFRWAIDLEVRARRIVQTIYGAVCALRSPLLRLVTS